MSRDERMALAIRADATQFQTAMTEAQTQFREFLARVLANPIAAAAFRSAQHAHPQPMRYGTAYRARARRRTRRNR